MKRDLKHARETASAPQSTAASAAGIQATFICGGLSGSALDIKAYAEREKELIRLASAGVVGLFCICVESINST